MYVAELEDRVSIVDLDGNVIGRFGSERSHDPGKFWGPHGIWTDSDGRPLRRRGARRRPPAEVRAGEVRPFRFGLPRSLNEPEPWLALARHAEEAGYDVFMVPGPPGAVVDLPGVDGGGWRDAHDTRQRTSSTRIFARRACSRMRRPASIC